MILFFCFLFALLGLLSASVSYFFFLSLVPLLLYLLLYKKQKKDIILYLFFFLLFFFLILLYPKKENGTIDAYGIVVKSKENYFLLLTLKGKFYVSEKNNPYSLFSVLEVKGEAESLSFSHYESGFSFQNYLKSQGVFSQLKVKEITLSFSGIRNLNSIRKYLLSYADENSSPFIEAFLFQESLYSEKSLASLNGLGILNLFSLSGFHLSFVIHVLKKLLGKKREKIGDILETVLLFLFLFFSSFSYTMRRLLLLAILKLISDYGKRKIDYLSRVSITALILLFFEPYSFFSASFYYAFPLLFLFALFPMRKEKKSRNPFSFFFRMQSFYLPYHLFIDGYISPLSILFSFLLIPYSHLLFLLSLLLLIAPQTAYLINLFCRFIIRLADVVMNVNFLLVSGKVSVFFILIYYILYAIVEFLRFYHFKRYTRYIALVFSISVSFVFIPDFLKHNEVTFIDVDQGDATLVRKGRTNVLIDTGGKMNVDLAKECLIPYFHKRKISSLDAVIITHPDYDHNGALISLKNSFPVNAVYTRDDFLEAKDNTIDIKELTVKNYNFYSFPKTEDDNYFSGVYAFTVSDVSFLIMGDAPKIVEKKIIKDNPSLHADVIKVGHHGSNTSSDYSFLKSLSPSLAIISCGENNKYGHPHKETLSVLSALNIPYRRTDIEGSITLSF